MSTDPEESRMPNAQQLSRFETGQGFIAALDQSGGSTPKALREYGVDESAYSSEAEMFDLIHEARARIITSPVFTSERILGAILFEGTLDRTIGDKGVTDYLWSEKGIIPFLKIDKGLEAEADGVQVMKDIPGLERTLARAAELGVFGTKERSVIHRADEAGIERVIDQQFELGDRVLAAGLVPILEPEVSVAAPDKAEAEAMLKAALLVGLERLGEAKVAIKVTIPTIDGFYTELIRHPNVARVVALSGGYARDDANERLARNPGLIASFSRALLDGLSAQQSAEEYNATLDTSIEAIYRASIA
ncbi:fructose bisphosphate aldolase [Microbacterium xanthum]|uniref:fructose bisphosphate aldolase n=1 Tax=Microbacterium xanthum TaxID=3079794 RepID=UPI002AD53F07|nr:MULTISPECIES: fructose bisphosphate aldolase [unclassified Microbacterium]MDZ8171771.1 fructose bisphosphate aldolase [Microbacterium sp. KSW-48]MDZ8200126.1 fructose bisphosphate aldolase [Microbacterium sp. SSW1-59]